MKRPEWKPADVDLPEEGMRYLEEARRQTYVIPALEAYAHALDVADPQSNGNEAALAIIREFDLRESLGDLERPRDPKDSRRRDMAYNAYMLRRKNPELSAALLLASLPGLR